MATLKLHQTASYIRRIERPGYHSVGPVARPKIDFVGLLGLMPGELHKRHPKCPCGLCSHALQAC